MRPTCFSEFSENKWGAKFLSIKPYCVSRLVLIASAFKECGDCCRSDHEGECRSAGRTGDAGLGSSCGGRRFIDNCFHCCQFSERSFIVFDDFFNGSINKRSVLIFDFLDMDRSFNLVIALVDIRHDPSKLDHQMIEFLQEGGFPFVVALTKADKLSRSQQGRQLATIRKQLNVPAEDIIVTSSQTGQGIDELKRRIEAACLDDEDDETPEGAEE